MLPLINDWTDIEIKIFFCGGRGKGESILLLIINKQTNLTLFTCLVDSFYGMYNYIKHKQIEYGFDHINCICWTHPHEDHTSDMYKIVKDVPSANDNETHLVNYKQYKKYNSYDTTIFYSKVFNQKRRNNRKKKIKEFYRIFSYDKKTSMLFDYVERVHSRGISIGDGQRNFRWDVLCPNKQDLVTIHFLTPSRDILSKTTNNPLRRSVKENFNAASLSFVLRVPGYCTIYFGGDSENDEIMELTDVMKDKIRECNIIKLPHHGSLGSGDLLQFLSQQLDYAITTVDNTSSLPSKNIIDSYTNLQYSENGGFLQTSCGILNDNCKMGVVEVTISYKNGQISNKFQIYGVNEDNSIIANE